jgi:hypothetical protein
MSVLTCLFVCKMLRNKALDRSGPETCKAIGAWQWDHYSLKGFCRKNHQVRRRDATPEFQSATYVEYAQGFMHSDILLWGCEDKTSWSIMGLSQFASIEKTAAFSVNSWPSEWYSMAASVPRGAGSWVITRYGLCLRIIILAERALSECCFWWNGTVPEPGVSKRQDILSQDISWVIYLAW